MGIIKTANKNKEEDKKKEIVIDDLELDSDGDAKTKKQKSEEGLFLGKSKIKLIKNLLANIQDSQEKLTQLLSGYLNEEDEARISISQMGEIKNDSEEKEEGPEGVVIEGVFDGENMIGPDGKQYSVPANYASKSKLVEGDILKLTITANGTFIYKQIGPIERGRVIGKLEQTTEGNFFVQSGNKKWKVLTASVTYFKGQANDEVVILIPKVGESKWAAVENIVSTP